MPLAMVWVIPGIAVWAVLQFVAVRFCTGWRDEKVKYGFASLGLLAWWLPNLLLGETGASEMEQLVLGVGFPVAAIYLSYLIIGEWKDRRNLEEWKARTDGEKLTIGFKGRE